MLQGKTVLSTDPETNTRRVPQVRALTTRLLSPLTAGPSTQSSKGRVSLGSRKCPAEDEGGPEGGKRNGFNRGWMTSDDVTKPDHIGSLGRLGALATHLLACTLPSRLSKISQLMASRRIGIVVPVAQSRSRRHVGHDHCGQARVPPKTSTPTVLSEGLARAPPVPLDKVYMAPSIAAGSAGCLEFGISMP
ncbi:hypothetical protein B0H17DRAFT_1146914 [Mycena rosella]|uniref:Uncharacterized protein n=1 Tax=Mycena rosella TaxID=1033263 RepID=A0AAD7CMU9_MYCRO|nr:hypothetical protein B0H17DRAFT_1146914 [Mycena rosella]